MSTRIAVLIPCFNESVAIPGVVAAHRGIVERYRSYRVARLLKALPLRSVWRPLLKAIALANPAPLATRALAMRLYRAALYAEAV